MTHALLTVEEHAELRVRPDYGAALGDAVMSCLVVPDEFRQVQAHFPILFRRTPERDSYDAVALFGFEPGENLFLDDARWDAGYRPLALAIQPFLIGGAPGATGDKQVHVDLASPRLSGAGTRVFDRDGRPTPFLEEIAAKLGALDQGYVAAGDFHAAVMEHDLLEPLTLEVALDDGATHRLVGYHAIDEDKLRSLDAWALGELHAAGHLTPLFMALASVGRISELVARKNRRRHG